MKIVSVISCSLFFLTSCENQNNPNYKGHWHSIKNGQPGVYQTLDINDTASIIDQYSLTGIKFHPLPLKDGKERVLPTMPPYYSSDIQVRGDTLIIEKEFHYSKQANCSFEDDLFSNLFIDIDLPKMPGEESLETLKVKSHISYISVGKLKEGTVYKNAVGELVTSESYFIQINDVLPGLEYIPVYLQSESYSLQDDEELVVCLNLDNTIPENLLKNILEHIEMANVKKTVYRVVWNATTVQPEIVRVKI